MSVPLKQRKVKRRKRAGGLLSEEKKWLKYFNIIFPLPPQVSLSTFRKRYLNSHRLKTVTYMYCKTYSKSTSSLQPWYTALLVIKVKCQLKLSNIIC